MGGGTLREGQLLSCVAHLGLSSSCTKRDLAAKAGVGSQRKSRWVPLNNLWII